MNFLGFFMCEYGPGKRRAFSSEFQTGCPGKTEIIIAGQHYECMELSLLNFMVFCPTLFCKI